MTIMPGLHGKDRICEKEKLISIHEKGENKPRDQPESLIILPTY
jgi:hypothetical protein